MLRRSLVESAGQFWQSTEFKNVANLDFENLKHLQNQGRLSLTEPSICRGSPADLSISYRKSIS